MNLKELSLQLIFNMIFFSTSFYCLAQDASFEVLPVSGGKFQNPLPYHNIIKVITLDNKVLFYDTVINPGVGTPSIVNIDLPQNTDSLRIIFRSICNIEKSTNFSTIDNSVILLNLENPNLLNPYSSFYSPLQIKALKLSIYEGKSLGVTSIYIYKKPFDEISKYYVSEHSFELINVLEKNWEQNDIVFEYINLDFILNKVFAEYHICNPLNEIYKFHFLPAIWTYEYDEKEITFKHFTTAYPFIRDIQIFLQENRKKIKR